MEPLYFGIVIGVIVLAVIIGAMAFTGTGEGLNPITIDNLDSIIRPSSSSP